jgi:hypothetical protein
MASLFPIHATAETGDWETVLNLLNKISLDTRDDLNCSIDINSVDPVSHAIDLVLSSRTRTAIRHSTTLAMMERMK